MISTLNLLDADWRHLVMAELEKPYLAELVRFLEREEEAGRTVYPPPAQRLAALAQTPFKAVKVVILGQDPYAGSGQAMGLSFSVPRGVRMPPSLKNIYAEIERDLGTRMPDSGDLSGWARQGVLLLNTILTVEAGRFGSHQRKGWERFTDALLAALSARRSGLVFMLWGNHAGKKAGCLSAERHLILSSSHPSPLGVRHGFRGCGHFGEANRYLQAQGLRPIDWSAVG